MLKVANRNYKQDITFILQHPPQWWLRKEPVATWKGCDKFATGRRRQVCICLASEKDVRDTVKMHFPSLYLGLKLNPCCY